MRCDVRRKKYRRDRRELIAALGHKCFKCGYKWRLEFHHLTKRTWITRKTNRWTRLKRYKEEAEAGIVVLACRTCNAQIGRPLDIQTEWKDEIEP